MRWVLETEVEGLEEWHVLDEVAGEVDGVFDHAVVEFEGECDELAALLEYFWELKQLMLVDVEIAELDGEDLQLALFLADELVDVVGGRVEEDQALVPGEGTVLASVAI